MKLADISSTEDKRTKILLRARNRKHKNPTKSKTTKLGSFIDVFGGMTGYDSPSQSGSVSSDTNY